MAQITAPIIAITLVLQNCVWRRRLMAIYLNETLGGRLPDEFHSGDVLGMRRTEGSAGEATFEIQIGPKHLNRHGTVHGGVLMAMLDTAGFWAVSDPDNATPPKAVTVSLNCNCVGRSSAGTQQSAQQDASRNGESALISLPSSRRANPAVSSSRRGRVSTIGLPKELPARSAIFPLP